MGFKIVASVGTAQMLRRNGIDCEVGLKASEVRDGAEGASIVDRIHDGEIDLILNTPAGSGSARQDGYEIRFAAVANSVPMITNVQGIIAVVQGIEALRANETTVSSIREIQHVPAR